MSVFAAGYLSEDRTEAGRCANSGAAPPVIVSRTQNRAQRRVPGKPPVPGATP